MEADGDGGSAASRQTRLPPSFYVCCATHWISLLMSLQAETLILNESMFAASAMVSGLEMELEEMKLPQLKEELGARGVPRVGIKSVLQRRLHGLMVQAAIEARMDEEGGE